MEIEHKHEENKGIFYIEEGSETIGRLTYTMPDAKTMLINHTGVEPRLRGQGIAYKLVIAATNFARQSNFKIIPACSYVRVVCNRNQELKSLVK